MTDFSIKQQAQAVAHQADVAFAEQRKLLGEALAATRAAPGGPGRVLGVWLIGNSRIWGTWLLARTVYAVLGLLAWIWE